MQKPLDLVHAQFWLKEKLKHTILISTGMSVFKDFFFLHNILTLNVAIGNIKRLFNPDAATHMLLVWSQFVKLSSL